MILRSCSSKLATLTLSTLLAACSSDENGAGGDGSGGGGNQTGDAGDSSGGADAGGGIDTSGCDTVVEPSDDDTETVQTALIDAMSDDTICLKPGAYSFSNELSAAEHQGLTLRGAGESREDVVLDFGSQTTGDDGVFSSDGPRPANRRRSPRR
jgi:hypothetical protein